MQVYKWEQPSASKRSSPSRPHQSHGFQLINRHLITPIELREQPLQIRVQFRLLYGKPPWKLVRSELAYLGIHRGLSRVYVAVMSIAQMTSKKIQVLRKLAKKSERHKAFLLITNRPTRVNHQTDPSLFEELAPHLGRHHQCLVFSWKRRPSQAQLAVLAGLIAGQPNGDHLIVPPTS